MLINRWQKGKPKNYIQSLGIDWTGPYPSSTYKMSKVVEFGGNSVLDIGCATGNYVEFYRKLGKYAAGVDLDLFRLHQARTDFNSGFGSASAGQLPFADKSFDTVTMWDVMEHTPDDVQTMREAIRIARKNILISVPKETDPLMFTSSGGITYLHYIDLTHVKYYTEKKVSELMQMVGVKHYQLDHWCHIYPVSAYKRVGLPRILTGSLDRLLWLLAWKNKQAFLRNFFIRVDLI